jgi:hypothetical protein
MNIEYDRENSQVFL